MFETLRQDVRFATRALRRNPGFAAAAIAVLALGIGANTAIFSAANAYFFRPLPFADADRLVLLYETNPEFGWTPEEGTTAAPANALDWRAQVEAFEDVALYRDWGVDDVAIRTDGDPVLVSGTTVTGNFFNVLGVLPELGRALRWEETWAEAPRVAVISHDLWVSSFGADPGVIGSRLPLALSDQDIQIVGVAPEGFSFPDDETDVWYTYGWERNALEDVSFRRAHFVRPVARLAQGVSLEEADAQLQVVVQRLQAAFPETNRVMGAGFMPIREFLTRDVRASVMVLLGAVAVLLLLACANVANLMLVRANDRTREIALRHALGAGRGRVARQMLTESVLLAMLGGALGLVLGWFGVRAMSAMTRLGIEGTTAMSLDARVVAFTVLAAGVSGVLFGALPALRSSSGDLHGALVEGGRGRSSGRRGLRLARLLVSAEVALALLLVVGAGLMVRSFWLLRNVDTGFRVEGALAVTLNVPSALYPERDQVLAFWDQFAAALESRPGIERAGTVSWLPLSGPGWSSQFQAEGWPADRVGFEILHRAADAGYFEALEIPLVRGRLFGPNDGPDDPYVVVINETFAREHFAGEEPIGQRIAYDRAATEESIWYEIVGIVGDQHQESPGTPTRAEVFESRNQDWRRNGWVVMRTDVRPIDVVPVVRDVLRELDPRIPLAEALPLRDVWAESMKGDRFILTLLGAFGAAALLLATVGVYGVTAQAARRRTQEIGIRMALGARRRDVLGIMFRQGLVVVGAGLVVGLGATLLATRALASLLYGIEPTDPATLASVVALLTVVALTACYLPARRATAVDPVDSLRAE
jgi:putative ABC transport system permease protein